MKQVVFKVGGALSSYIEYDGKYILVDVGKNSDFNPVTDFLKPLFLKREGRIDGKYSLDQLIISHPHNDHMSSIKDFDKSFHAKLLTCPNDNEGQDDKYKVNWNLVDNPSDDYTTYLREKMLPGRKPPLVPSNPITQFVYYIKSRDCENGRDLDNKNYTNNLSIAQYFRINNHTVFMPGDLMKDGIEFIIKYESSLRRRLSEGVDVLIAPHHGLKSSFSTKLFDTMKDKKTRCLNIVSEKPTTADSNRVVDSRYSSSDYCKGINNFSSTDSITCQKKTSGGHIFIDYSNQKHPKFEIISDTNILINRFS